MTVTDLRYYKKETEMTTTIKKMGDTGVFVPQVNKSYHITKDVEKLFERLETKAKDKTQKVMLKGPHGSGKTEMAMQFAARTGRPLLIMNCANLKEPREWFGYREAENGSTRWHESQFDKTISAGGHVVLFDEYNRAHSTIHNTLIPLLDGRGFTYLEEKGGTITVGPDTVFFATMNEGAAYAGTHAIDAAMKDRWSRIVEVTYLPAAKEIDVLMARSGIDKKNAKSLVDIANQIRKKATGLSSTYSDGFSTRQLIAAAEDFVIDGVDSLTFTMTNLFSADGGTNSERAAILQLIQGKFGVAEVAEEVSPAKSKLNA